MSEKPVSSFVLRLRRRGDWVRPAFGEEVTTHIQDTIFVPLTMEHWGRGRNYKFEENDITKVLSIKPLEVDGKRYDALIAASNPTHYLPDVFYQLGRLEKPKDKFGGKLYASISPVVVNLTAFQHPFDYKDLIPISVMRAKEEIRQYLKNGHWVSVFVDREDIDEATKRLVSLNAQVVAMKAALYEGKLERYLQFYDVLFPLDANGKAVDELSAYERSINNEALGQLVGEYGSPISKMRWKLGKSIDLTSLRPGLIKSGYRLENDVPQIEASTSQIVDL